MEKGSSNFRVLPATAWERSLSTLRNELDSHIYSAYIEPLEFKDSASKREAASETECSNFVVTAPSRFVCNHVQTNFGDRIKSLVSNEIGSPNVNIEFIVGNSSAAMSTKETPYLIVKKPPLLTQKAENPATEKDRFSLAGLNPRYSFSNFVVCNSNQFCHAAASRVAEDPGKNYNPLFIYSGVGLGKTHLLHAIGNAVLERYPLKKVLYMSSEAFTNELILALKNAKMDEFKKRFRSIDVLLIDDIQFIAGKERTQEEFFHTFNTLYNLKNQIVITSDKIPSAIVGIEERLQTRFSWGLTADIQSPDFETRVAILRRKATLESFDLPEDVANFLAEKITSNVRELEGALTRLHAVSTLQKTPIDVDFTASALRDLLQPRTISVSVDDIKKAVSLHYSLKIADLSSKRRTRNLSLPRHIAMYLCRKHTTASYPEIGYQFGGRDHSSVIHAAHVVSSKLSLDNSIKEAIEEIERKLFSTK
ncbi:MAG: chromosomal replication initiator protein DnaA [SAR324 cluster bacterium]|uniref:Chromosomal replication initiator protein DnaA n=1 Tax=SAR324 cluster bacterium TaxID=2024889 RepID=A0A7X9IKL5_9DELT|nr:chromosomal replication initiator protein DnaA [SAR324 cluster bacterium]